MYLLIASYICGFFGGLGKRKYFILGSVTWKLDILKPAGRMN